MSELVLRWSWRHHSLQVTEADSVDAAVASFFYGQEAGEEAPCAIEVFADGASRRIDGDDLNRLIDAYEQQTAAAYPVDTRPWVAKVVIASADGPAPFEWFHDRDEAERVGERLMRHLGNRVSIESVKR